MAGEIVDISDEMTVAATYEGGSVVLALDSTAVARNRLRVDARKWYAGKLSPKKYGEKLALSGDADNPIHMVTRIERVIVDSKQ